MKKDKKNKKNIMGEPPMPPQPGLLFAEYDLDANAHFVSGTISYDGNVLEWGTAENRQSIAVSDIRSVTMRNEFGTFEGEILTKNDETIVLLRATAAKADRLTMLLKALEAKVSGLDAYGKRPLGGMPPMGAFGTPSGAPLGGPAGGPAGGPPPDGGAGGPGGPGFPPPEDSAKISKRSIFKRLIDVAVPHKTGIIFTVIIYLATVGISLVTPKINQVLVDNFINDPSKKETIVSSPSSVMLPFVLTILVMLGFEILTWAVEFVRNIIMMDMGIAVVVDFRKKMYEKVQKMSLRLIEKKTTGSLMTRISSDADELQSFVNSWVPNFFGEVLLLICVLIVLICYDWKLLLVVALSLPLAIVPMYYFERMMHKIFGRKWEAESRSNSVLQDILSGIRVVKSYGTEEREGKRFADSAADLRDLDIKTETMFALLRPCVSLGISVGNFIFLYYTGTKILGGSLTIGQCAMFSSYMTMIYGPIRWLASFPSRLVHTMTSAQKIFELLDEEEMEDNGKIDRRIEGDISFEHVSFGYEGTQTILKDVNLEIKPGEMLGLVGRSGVGKTTLTNLIMRLYEPDLGCIKVDGTDIRDYDSHCLRSQLGAVLQETVLFSDTLYNNIAYAKPDAKYDEVLDCARAAGVHDFAVKLPDGYNTKVGDRGYTLSGGERQRVAIARAILRNPRILILDEATSALDTEMEKQIQEAIERLIKDRTTIAIAHRLSTLRNAAKIAVIDEGTVAEFGTHQELMEKKGIYYELVLAQRSCVKV